MLLVVFLEKIHLGQFDFFSLQAIFYCLIGHGEIEPQPVTKYLRVTLVFM